MKAFYLFLCMTSFCSVSAQRNATIREDMQTIKTYPFSDPDPVADPTRLFYPYFRFDGFASEETDKDWKVVTLENDYICVSLLPEIGGKVWGAVDKTTGKEFIYQNHVVKFRDIAMRGPWTSGGIEFNFGIIGHAPTTSTPVDYLARQHADGSVSCHVSSYDWITKTWWTVEINLQKDKAYFTTNTLWHNTSSVDQPYYQWMNAGYHASGNAQFCYPGTHYIGHGGEAHDFPVDEQGRDISWYEKNNFGNSKSYHVIGKYNDFYGLYWHDADFGSVHHARYDDKLGMKIFLWGLSREGGIWEDLLTDTDGQYIELQSGRMYNQPASNSSYSPYKHTAFAPQATDAWTEFWYPVKDTRGVVKANETGALNVLREDGFLKLYFSPLQKLATTLKIYDGDKLLESHPLNAGVLRSWKDSIPLDRSAPEGKLRIVIGDNLLTYSELPADNNLRRPIQMPADFNWNSAYGLYVQGEQWMNQKVCDKAERFLKASLRQEAYFIPALTRLASLYYRQGRIEEALALCRKGLSVNTYEGELNYIYGLCNEALENYTDAKDGFSVASYSPFVRSAAYVKLAGIYLRDNDWGKAEQYALKALDSNKRNLTANQVLMVVYRKSNQLEKAKELASSVLAECPLYHPVRYEQYRSGMMAKDDFNFLIRNELPSEVYLEIADWYKGVNCVDEALDLLSMAQNNPIANYETAYLLHHKGNESEAIETLEKANAQSPGFVYPHRPSSLKALEWAGATRPDWKPDYYQGLIYWANQEKEKTLTLFDRITAADYAPFYLCRASMKNGEAKFADLRKAEQLEKSWRTGFALISYYEDHARWAEAVRIGKSYLKLYPANYYIGLKYARALCESAQYQACISFLDGLRVLPNEGAYAGRAVYRAANLNQAMDLLSQKKYKAVLRKIDDSRRWPENLGVGKPYDDMIDNRLEHYLEARVCMDMGDQARSTGLLRQIAYPMPDSKRFTSADLLTALALRDLSCKEEADRLVAGWSEVFPDNKLVQWSVSIYNGEREKAKKLLSDRRIDRTDTTPWETSSHDADLDLILRYFR